jgi:hypothetical protein
MNKLREVKGLLRTIVMAEINRQDDLMTTRCYYTIR